MKTIIAMLLIFAPLATVNAQLLKCVGKDGKVEYAAQCPTGTKEQQTGIKSTKEGPKTDAKAAQKSSLAEREADFRKRQTEQAQAAAKKAEEDKDAEASKANCHNARAHLTAIESGERIVIVDPATGERSYLDDAGRAKALAQARASVAGWCK